MLILFVTILYTLRHNYSIKPSECCAHVSNTHPALVYPGGSHMIRIPLEFESETELYVFLAQFILL